MEEWRMDFTANMNSLFDKLENFFKTETVFGQPMQVGKITLIPVISVAFGAGGGGGTGKDPKGTDGSGSGSGAGGRISPSAIIVIKDDEVSVMPLTNRGSIDKIVEMIPEIMSKASCHKSE